MADVELTEIQTSIYEVILEVESISKKKLAAKMKTTLRTISSPIKALIDRGVLVMDEYGDLSIAAGVREEPDAGYVTVPTVPEVPSPQTASETDVPVEEVEADDLYSEYWQLHPEELVTFHGEEGMDALKRAALMSAMKSAVGVGQKALDAALHWYDIDDDVRRDPTALMRALEDAGVKHNLVGRIARETFLPEKQFGSYIQGDDVPFIQTGRPTPRRRAQPSGRRNEPDDDGFDDDEYYERPMASRRRSRSRDDDMPWWAQSLVQRLDAIDGGTHGRGQRSEQPQVVIEPVLDEYGNPVPDPNNPGQYLERKVIYEQPSAGMPDSGMVSELKEQLAENNEAIAKMRDTIASHETDRKISSAMDPLLSKIATLERTGPAVKSGMTDEQFKMQTEKEILQDVSNSVENTVANVIEPVLAGVADVQKMQTMREIIEMERVDKVAPGTYLKYMGAGEAGGDPITKDRIGNTIDMIKNKSGAR